MPAPAEVLGSPLETARGVFAESFRPATGPEYRQALETEIDPPIDIHDRAKPDGADIRKITVEDVPMVASSLARAFYDDPHMKWVIRNDQVRLSRLQRGFATYLNQLWLKEDESYTADTRDGHPLGAALWVSPESSGGISPLSQIGMLPAVASFTREDMPRMLKVASFMERYHKRFQQEHGPHYYLPVLGVNPSWQSLGYGGALLKPVLDKCDEGEIPAYLEASNPQNRKLYERQGFELIEEVHYADDGPPLYLMGREAPS